MGFFRDPESPIPGFSEKSLKSRNPGDRDRDLKIPKKSRKKNSGVFLVSGFLSPGFGIFFVSGFLLPGFGIFLSRDFYSRDSGFFLISGFLSPRFYAKSPGFGIFSGFFTFGIYTIGSGFFLVGWDIQPKSNLCL